MAIDLNKQEIIRNMITEKLEWTSEEIQEKLSVSPSWVSKNLNYLPSSSSAALGNTKM